jgi:hypothetical protein
MIPIFSKQLLRKRDKMLEMRTTSFALMAFAVDPLFLDRPSAASFIRPETSQ